MHKVHTDHVMIRSELNFLIEAKIAGTVRWIHGPGTTRPKIRGFMSAPDINPAKAKQFGFLAGFGT
jgi:hypothetical protein